MAFDDLRSFVSELERRGELLRVRSLVSRDLEITEITDRMSKLPNGGRALLFENVEGSRFPVLTNAFGSERRTALALGSTDLEAVGDRVSDLLRTEMPRTLGQKAALAPMAMSLLKCFPKTSRGRAPCQEVVLKGDDVDLGILPALKSWPQDGGRFITLPAVFTKDADGKRNVGMYRMQVFDKTTTGMHWHVHKDGALNFSDDRRSGRRTEVAVAIGCDPAVMYAATAPMPQGLDELILAGFLRGSPVRLAKCVTVDMEVPAASEFVLEGYVDHDETRLEGPFGDHTGYYSLADMYPVLHVTAVTHRRDAIYPATVVGRPPMEDCYLAKATERVFLPPLRMLVPEIDDIWMPWEGVFHNIVAVAISKRYPGQARKVMSSMWGNNQMSLAKMVLVVDDASLLKDGRRLLRHVLDTVDFASDVTLTDGVLDVLDHSAPAPLRGSKLGVDATARAAGEDARRRPRFKLTMSGQGVLDALRSSGDGFLGCRVAMPDAKAPLILVSVDKGGAPSQRFKEAIRASGLLDQGVFVMYDGVDLSDGRLLLWKMFNNVDPERDITIDDGVIIDATRKGLADGHAREWPDEIVMSPDIVSRVEARRGELGL